MSSSERSIGMKKPKAKRKINEGFLSVMRKLLSERKRLLELLAKSIAERQLDMERKDESFEINGS
uniref:Deoxyuridine 5'-triphosphate nucleotidohydrolase n=1 Tax=Solanum tuberosum TaxID=4113 RepID=M1CAV3_SOLTU